MIGERRRFGRLRLITGMEARCLAVPWRCLRGPVNVNRDYCYIDVRRYRRQVRKVWSR